MSAPPRLELIKSPDCRQLRAYLRDVGVALLEGAESPNPEVVYLALLLTGLQAGRVAELLGLESQQREAA